MNWIKENWFKAGVLAILVIVVFGGFYWFEYRPAGIRKLCRNSAGDSVNRVYETGGYTHDDEPRLYELFYQNCIKGRYGLDK